MKRLIAVLAIAVSSPILAEAGKPFEQVDLDRALPSSVSAYVGGYERSSAADDMPFEQTQLDRGAIGESERVQLAQIGNASYKSDEGSESPFANDHNFVAPAP
jgi:hypothetical protein